MLDENQSVISEDLHNSAVVAGITGATIQLTVRYWVKTDAVISDGKTRSEIIISIMKALKENGFTIK